MFGKNGFIVVFLGTLLLSGCGHQPPQRPSQRRGTAPEPDSAQMALLELNRQLAEAADCRILEYVQAQEEPYALYESNTWMAILNHGDENSTSPMQDEEWGITMRVYSLNGELYNDYAGNCKIGRNELPAGVEANMNELHHGAKARMVIPWYAAYGVTGTENIPPYENIIVELELK